MIAALNSRSSASAVQFFLGHNPSMVEVYAPIGRMIGVFGIGSVKIDNAFYDSAQACLESVSASTRWRIGSPATYRSASSTMNRPIRDSSLPWEPATCGVRKTFGRS